MTSYHLLQQDPFEPGSFGVGGGPEDLDPTDWIKGRKIDGWSKPITLQLHEGSEDVHPDIVSGLVPLFSSRLKEVLSTANVDNVDYFPVTLVHPESKRTYDDYLAANVIGLLKAVDPAKSTFRGGGKRMPGVLAQFTVDEQAARGFKLFRLFESPRLIVIDEDLKTVIEAAKLTGVYVQPTQEWTGSKGGGYFK